jgi:hypothetical protein
MSERVRGFMVDLARPAVPLYGLTSIFFLVMWVAGAGPVFGAVGFADLALALVFSVIKRRSSR